MRFTTSHRSRPGPIPGGQRCAPRRAMAVLMAMAVAALSILTAPPGDAQATYVFASVRTDPVLPQPGQDVHVSVRITGCPPGATQVDVLLQANADEGISSALMATGPARTSLLWRTRARIDLPSAIQGWYGVRVQCGTYLPPEVPMTGTSFVVGAVPTAALTLGSDTVAQGGSVTLHGTDCPGPSVDYEIRPRAQSFGGFTPSGSAPTQADGTWTATVPIAPNFPAGGALVKARCAVPNDAGTIVYTSYGFPLDLRVLTGS